MDVDYNHSTLATEDLSLVRFIPGHRSLTQGNCIKAGYLPVRPKPKGFVRAFGSQPPSYYAWSNPLAASLASAFVSRSSLPASYVKPQPFPHGSSPLRRCPCNFVKHVSVTLWPSTGKRTSTASCHATSRCVLETFLVRHRGRRRFYVRRVKTHATPTRSFPVSFPPGSCCCCSFRATPNEQKKTRFVIFLS